jgi:hypothetical protein
VPSRFSHGGLAPERRELMVANRNRADILLLIPALVSSHEVSIMADEVKNVFISHLHEDDSGLADLKELIGKGGLTVRDSSINSSNPNDAKDPDYIKSQILAPQIQWASTLLVYITPKTKESEWVNWEIEYAEKCGKRIVGAYAHGANECDCPEALEKYADDVRGWQSDGIINAILGKTNEWHKPSGELRDPRPIKRYGCGV